MSQTLTVEHLIDTALRACQTFQRYQGDHGKIRFLRERNSLLKAIARFGHICHQRGWDFTAEEILPTIMQVIISVRGREDEIRAWLPRYLECAIDKHVRLKADDYAAKAKARKTIPALTTKVIAGTQRVEAIREPTHMEILAMAYGDKGKTIRANLKKSKQKPAPAPAQAQQPTFF